jgi:hypothetical protein
MIDRIKAFREPATIVAIIVVLVGIAATSGRIATDLHTYPLAQVLRGVSGLYGLVDALVLTVLALACVLVTPKTRHAEQLTLGAALLLWLGAVVGLVFLVVSLLAAGEGSWSRILESIGGLTDIALRGLMGYVRGSSDLSRRHPRRGRDLPSGTRRRTSHDGTGSRGRATRTPTGDVTQLTRF